MICVAAAAAADRRRCTMGAWQIPFCRILGFVHHDALQPNRLGNLARGFRFCLPESDPHLPIQIALSSQLNYTFFVSCKHSRKRAAGESEKKEVARLKAFNSLVFAHHRPHTKAHAKQSKGCTDTRRSKCFTLACAYNSSLFLSSLPLHNQKQVKQTYSRLSLCVLNLDTWTKTPN